MKYYSWDQFRKITGQSHAEANEGFSDNGKDYVIERFDDHGVYCEEVEDVDEDDDDNDDE
jgi:hypothetical protein